MAAVPGTRRGAAERRMNGSPVVGTRVHIKQFRWVGAGRGAAERRINGSPIVGARATLCNWTQLGLCVRNLILSKDE